MIVSGEFGPYLGYIAQERRDDHIILCIDLLFVPGKRLIRISKRIRTQRVSPIYPRPMRIVRTPVEKKGPIVFYIFPAGLGHTDVVATEFLGRVSVRKWIYIHRSVVLFSRTIGSIASRREERREGLNVIKTGEVMDSMGVTKGTICVIVHTCQYC